MSEFDLVVGEESINTSVTCEVDSILVKIGGDDYRFVSVGENLFRVTVNGAALVVAVVKHKDVIYVDIDAAVLEVHEATSAQNSLSASSHNLVKDKVFAPMPGKIVKIMVIKGDAVSERQPLAIVEAMKMENQINSPASGKVKAVNFAVGDQVNTTNPLIELELETGQ